MTGRVRPPVVASSTDISRSLGALISASSIVLIVAEAARFLDQVGAYAPWWTTAGGMMILLSVVAAIGARRLSQRALVALWTGFVLLLVALELSLFLGYQGTDPDALFPWVWRFESIAVCYFVLLSPPILALAFPLVAALLPAASGLLFLERVPDVVLSQTPLHMGNIVFAVLFVAMRSRLLALSRTEEAARAEEARRAMLDAQAERQEAFNRVVHDELLSVFSAAMNVADHPPSILRREADRALDRLQGAFADSDEGDAMLGVDAAEHLVAAVTRSLPAVRIIQECDDTYLPIDAVKSVCSALGEAARNAARHAPGAPAILTIRISGGSIDVALRDEGPGFVPGNIAPGRLGVRESILGRMRHLPGGAASVEVSPSGTTVVAEWHPR